MDTFVLRGEIHLLSNDGMPSRRQLHKYEIKAGHAECRAIFAQLQYYLVNKPRQ
jgi:hypothetical protein